jgi:hypothetical protein
MSRSSGDEVKLDISTGALGWQASVPSSASSSV